MLVFSKGAPEEIFGICSHWYSDHFGSKQSITSETKYKIRDEK